MEVEQLTQASLWAIGPLVLVGSLLHFVYEWSGGRRLVAIVGAVNESYWEHIKIAVWPVAVLQVALFALGGHEHPSFVPAATVALYSIPIGMYGIVTLYKLATGRNVLWIDILAFAVCILLAQAIFVVLLEQLDPSRATIVGAGVYGAALLVAFACFTLHPPSEPDLFVDPISGGYGRPDVISAHPEGHEA